MANISIEDLTKAIEIISARVKCLKHMSTGNYEECCSCPVIYEQGTVGEQIDLYSKVCDLLIQLKSIKTLGEMREATPEEVQSVADYVASISAPTGVTFDQVTSCNQCAMQASESFETTTTHQLYFSLVDLIKSNANNKNDEEIDAMLMELYRRSRSVDENED